MGTWAHNPWDNDSAADWYGDLIDKCKVRSEWLNGINKNVSDEPEVVRAAVGFFILLGRIYMWPIKNYDSDLELAISKSVELLKIDEFNDYPEITALIKMEITELESRRRGDKKTPPPITKPWWEFW